MKVLLIEDDEAQAAALQQLLVTAGQAAFTVEWLDRLSTAVEALATRRFDAILLDLTLPDSDGLDTFRRVHAAATGAPVIVFSATDDESWGQQAVAEGAQDYLVKGQVSVPALVRSIRYSVERHRAQAAARESEERFRLLVEGVQDYAIFMIDPDGRIVSWNVGAQRMTGYAAEEAIGRHVSHFYTPEDRERQAADEGLRRAAERGAHRDSGWRVRKDGSRFLADVTTTALLDADGRVRGFSKVTRDVTEQRRTAEDLIAYQDRLRRLAAELNRNEDEERRRLASILHDGIGQALAAAQIKLDMVPPEDAAHCEDTFKGVHELIREAIELTRTITFDLSPPVLYQVGLPAALVSLADRVRRRHGLTVDVCCRGTWTPMISPETRGLLYQAIRELVMNVVKHARARRVAVNLMRRNPAPDGTPGWMHVRVEDDGAGFDTSVVCSMTQPGGGFGLFNLRERLIQAQGRLSIQSAPGQGTAVELEVPFELAAREGAHVVGSG